MISKRGKPQEKKNKELLERCREGDVQAWEEIVRTFSPLVWTVARSHRVSPNDCEEIYQITWERLLENLSHINRPERLGTWLTTVARRESIRHSESARFTVNFSDPQQWDLLAVSPDTSPENQTLRRTENEIVLKEIRKLPDQHQALVSMLFSDPPIPYEVISSRLGIPRGSIGPMRKRIMARLREGIDSHFLTAEII